MSFLDVVYLVSDRRRAGKIKSVHVRRHLPATGPQSDLTGPLSTSRTSSMVPFSVHFFCNIQSTVHAVSENIVFM